MSRPKGLPGAGQFGIEGNSPSQRRDSQPAFPALKVHQPQIAMDVGAGLRAFRRPHQGGQSLFGLSHVLVDEAEGVPRLGMTRRCGHGIPQRLRRPVELPPPHENEPQGKVESLGIWRILGEGLAAEPLCFRQAPHLHERLYPVQRTIIGHVTPVYRNDREAYRQNTARKTIRSPDARAMAALTTQRFSS